MNLKLSTSWKNKHQSIIHRAPVIFLLMISLCTSACGLGYYTHLTKGQLQLIHQRKPIEKVLADPKTQPALKRRLRLTRQVLEFAEKKLQLDVDGQYSHYVALNRPYALWSLSAAPKLSFTPYQWCYPIIGCANYRGYFELKRAQADAAQLQQMGFETHVRGVSAYSTLGWFADPILSSFARYSDEHYIELIFHELAHAKLYVKDDTTFNESFASFVGQQGLQQFQQAHALANTGIAKQSKADFKAFKSLVFHYKAKLEKVYQANKKGQTTRAIEAQTHNKHKIMAQFRAAYHQEKKNWSTPNAYDHWVKEMNNAHMLIFADYESQIPLFHAIFQQCKQDWQCFYAQSKQAH